MLKRLLLMLCVVILAGCASAPEATTAADNEINAEFDINHPDDPFEKFNRAMWTINYNYLDPYILRPTALAYTNYVPSFLRTGVRNFINNLDEPFMVVNNLLALNGKAALNHFNRFWINSTFGIGGLLDIASKAGEAPQNNKQFGDVLGRYGVGQGPYLVIPGYGSLTVREGVGDAVDGLYPPLALLTFPQSLLKWVFGSLEDRASLVSQEAILNNSPDPYVFVRDAYLQNKEFRANGSKEQPAVLNDEFLSEELLDEADDY